MMTTDGSLMMPMASGASGTVYADHLSRLQQLRAPEV
jgi:hypothetical protein